MTPSPVRPVRRPRGTTLIEAVIALAVLLIGITGTMQLQVLGITSNAGGRAATHAYQLARELAQALTQLPPDDALLAPDFVADAPPPQFGHLLQHYRGGVVATSFKTWADGMPLPGVSSDADVYRRHGPDPETPAQPLYQRRWQVWQLPAAIGAGGGGGLNMVAVSVIYREPRMIGWREVVLLTQVSNTGLAAASLAAYR